MSNYDVLTSTEAREEFGWSRDMMTKLLKSGTLPFTTDPLDKRLKWVKRSDVARLNQASRKRRRQPQPPNDTAGAQMILPGAAGAAPPTQTSVTSSCPVPALPSPLETPNRKDARAAHPSGSSKLKPSDQVVLTYLRTLCAVTGTDTTPPIGYEAIADRCGICPRQAQICCDRLVAAHILERLGYDAGHPDLTKRGMVYRVKGAEHDSIQVAARAHTCPSRRA